MKMVISQRSLSLHPERYIRNSREDGFLVAEALIGVMLAVLILCGFTAILLKASSVEKMNEKNFTANMHLRELIEAVNDLEQSDWAMLNITECAYPNICHPETDGGAWKLVSGKEVIGEFERSLTVEPVYRDKSELPNSIVLSGGVLDEYSKKVRATVTDRDGGIKELEIFVYSINGFPK